MNGSFFAGSYGGDASALAADSRLECPVCWYVYDPANGDDLAQIPAGTPFAGLPDDWTCPNCDGRKAVFMLAAHRG